MIDKTKFENLVFEGLRSSYSDAFSFTGQVNTTIKPEYLLTVNIAKSLDSLNKENKDWGNPLIIKLEESTRQFAMACVPLFSNSESLFDNDLRDFHNSERPGRVDIAIYEHTNNLFDQKPYALIEIKGFVNTISILKRDIERNLEFHGLIDNKTGPSRLEKSYMVFLHRHENCIVSTKKQEGIDKLIATYAKYLSISDLFKDCKLKYRIEAKTIAENLINPEQKDWPNDVLQGIYEESYHYIGVLIVIEKD